MYAIQQMNICVKYGDMVPMVRLGFVLSAQVPDILAQALGRMSRQAFCTDLNVYSIILSCNQKKTQLSANRLPNS